MKSTILSRIRSAALAFVLGAVAITSGMLASAPPMTLPVAAGAGLMAAATAADARVSLATAVRNSRCSALVTFAGANAKLKAYNGTAPSGTSAITGGNTLLASGAFGLTIGSCTSGVLDWDEAGFTQTSSGFVAGTPTFFDVTTSGDVVVGRVEVCTGSNAPCWTWTGAIATNQNITLTSLTFTEGNQ